MQVTAQRVAVYRAVQRLPHAIADEISQDVKQELGTISRQAVYDALNAMAEYGIYVGYNRPALPLVTSIV